MFIRAYLRASTKEQDASRAEQELKDFAQSRGLTIAATYRENESGASLRRPELFRLLADSSEGDVLLVEQVDRLSRLNDEDWKSLRAEIAARKLLVVSLDLPTSHTLIEGRDGFEGRMLEAINGMMLDMLAAIARKDYEDRRRRQLQGVQKAKAEGRYRGRPEDTKRNAEIMDQLRNGVSWDRIIANHSGTKRLSRSTIAKLSKRLKEEAQCKSDAAAQGKHSKPNAAPSHT